MSDEAKASGQPQPVPRRAMPYPELDALLKARGVALTIWGCGCCGSPTVSLSLDGVVVINDEPECCFPDEPIPAPADTPEEEGNGDG